ncbi:MAG TPA: cell surface protein SprA, partial [Cytophagales bacterium]|nr:cell surface protein SprA [Cytophagales bacterium]
MCVAALASVAEPSSSISFLLEDPKIFRQDTSKKDTNQKYKPSRRPLVNPQDRYGNPLTERPSSPLLLPNPSNIETEVEMDTANNFYIREKVGERNYRAPSTMTLDEYSKIQQQNYLRNYWKSKSEGLDGESDVTGRSLIPKIYISPVFDRIFGGNYVDIKPNGFVSLDFGVRSQRVNNPAYPIRQQRQPPNFDFDQQISMNVTGKIGEKATITSNFDTKSSFQFENNIKFDYTGFEEDIIKKIEIGNVNLPLNNSLMQGAQNLFGIKTQLQFGKLYVTSVASTQRGTRENVQINGGSQKRNFEIRADNYEDNRHFFLSHFFRENYETALNSLPNPSSGVNVPQNRVEVYVINRSNNTDALRSIVGLADLGESRTANIGNKAVVKVSGREGRPTDNTANSLYSKVINNPTITTNADAISDALIALGLARGTDFEKINGARRLTERDFTVHPTLGYISLNTSLKPDEILAVAYQYTYQGKTFKVGELTEDYQNKTENEAVFLKLIRPNSIITKHPMWDLMMKNIYPLGASGINRDNFQFRLIYRDDNTGLDNPALQEGVNTKNVPLLQLFEMDQLNANNDPQPDGNFDYIEGITIDPRYGRVIFPVLEPFGSDLAEKFHSSETALVNKYVFQELYDKTKQDASLTAGKNKFFLVGNYQASGAEGVNLNAIGIAQGSVRVTQGGTVLEEHVDYEVDYNTGQVTFLKEQYNQPGADIDISYEKDEFFTPTTKTLLGTRLDYRVNKDFNIGGTMMYLNERPLISRI